MTIGFSRNWQTCQALVLSLRFTYNRPNKFLGMHCSSRGSNFNTKIFSRQFLFLFVVKKKRARLAKTRNIRNKMLK